MKIFIAGDSTFQYNNSSTYPQTGIGQKLPLFFTNLSQPDLAAHDIDEYTGAHAALGEAQNAIANSLTEKAQTVNENTTQAKPQNSDIQETVTFLNFARNGRSTKSFINEGRLAFIDSEISKGDFLFIVFGHNDEKIQDPTRYTEPDGEYKKNLRIFAQTAQKHGAFPVFFTPVARRAFDNTGKRAIDTHKQYSDSMKDFAKEEGFPVIDLSELSRKLISKLGMADSARLYMNLKPGIYANFPEGRNDNTHLNPDGAFTFASLCVQGIIDVCGSWHGKNAEAYNKLASCIRPPKNLVSEV